MKRFSLFTEMPELLRLAFWWDLGLDIDGRAECTAQARSFILLNLYNGLHIIFLRFL